jgi:hypothetical protein
MPIAPKRQSQKVRLPESPTIDEDKLDGLIDYRWVIVLRAGSGNIAPVTENSPRISSISTD